MRVLGVDACRGGWVGICLDGGGGRAVFGTSIADVVANAGDEALDVVAVDIPIGLPDNSRRRCDELAKKRIGARSSSVFMTPTRPALEAPTHAAAVVVNRELVQEGLSVQAFGLRHRLFEVEQWLPGAGCRVVEVHPEVCFAEMAGRPLLHSKSRWAGCEERRELLDKEGISLHGQLGAAGARAAVDDVLDAAAAAWTARRVAAGGAFSIPSQPEHFSDGWPCAMWV